MAKYDVECKKCGEFEIEKKMTEELPKCPKCDGSLEQVFNYAPPVKFNGTGFYETDYKK